MRKNGKKTLTSTRTLSRSALSSRRRVSAVNRRRLMLGRYIVADSAICHGEPTFRGTRIMVWQVLEMLTRGLAWETIIEECHKSIAKDAIAEAIKLSGIDDREIIRLLRSLHHPTLFAVDYHFYKRGLCHARYCLVQLDVAQPEAAHFVRRVLRHPDFNTHAKRMGVVIRASQSGLTV